MSDMSFKQAREIADRLEMSELSLNSILIKVDKATKVFDETLNSQKQIANSIPKKDDKIVYLKILIGINFGFILGLLASKYIL